MTNKDLMKLMADIECALYYRIDGSDNPEGIGNDELRKAHDMIDELLNYWYELTGCIID